MGKYVGIFFLTLFGVGVLFFVLPMFIWRVSTDIDFVSFLGSSLVILAAFIIAQLFYIIDLLKRRNG